MDDEENVEELFQEADMPQNPGFYAIIPAHIRYCKDLEPMARLLYAEITCLTHQKGYCWAKNEYFAQLYQVDIRSIKNWISSLQAKGFIKCQIVRNGFHQRRRIWISPEIQKMFTKGKNCHHVGKKISPGPGDTPYYINNKEKKEMSDIASDQGKPAVCLSEPSARLTQIFYEKIKEINPKIRKPNFKSWGRVFELMLRVDNRTEHELNSIITYIVDQHENPKDEFTWSKAVQSPEKLRKHFASIWMEITSNNKLKKNLQHNINYQMRSQEAAAKFVKKYFNIASSKKIRLNDFVDHLEIGNDRLYYTNPKFEELLTHYERKYFGAS